MNDKGIRPVDEIQSQSIMRRVDLSMDHIIAQASDALVTLKGQRGARTTTIREELARIQRAAQTIQMLVR